MHRVIQPGGLVAAYKRVQAEGMLLHDTASDCVLTPPPKKMTKIPLKWSRNAIPRPFQSKPSRTTFEIFYAVVESIIQDVTHKNCRLTQTGSHPSWSSLLHLYLFFVHFYGVVDPDSSAVDLSTALVFCRCATMFYASINIHNTWENKTKLHLINHTVAFST